MTRHRLRALLAAALAVLATGSVAPGAGAEACRQTDVVFYTTDTVRLATELGKSASACADYYLSITPNGVGGPRGGAPITTIRGLGPRFHAMAEIRLNVWSTYAAANGWYAAGVEARRQMRAAGYDASRGDTWAINELGAPSTALMGIDVLRNGGSARADLREFVRGLHDGDDGVASSGLVFVADPAQAATGLAQYEQELESWYADSGFWTDMARYVRFWAQETYADASRWGVAGAALAERRAYLDDYLLHGIRLAQREDGPAAAARAFLAEAYTPVGNAAFRWPGPDPVTGIGFGMTDVGLDAMLSFVSAQTEALRRSTPQRFGFAVVPRNALASETVAVEARVAQAIASSESDPASACGAAGELCSATVAGAQFNDAWKRFANTLEGAPVAVAVAPGLLVRYPAVTARGSTWVETAPLASAPPGRFRALPGALRYELATTAVFAAPVELCAAYDPGAYEGLAPHLFRLGAGGWTDVTSSTGADAVCGSTDALGTFAVFAADPTPPTIVARVDGPLGDDGWYTGDVTVEWSVADPQSPDSLVTSGCEPAAVKADTPGATLTCTATSDGGTASASVTVKRDATPPDVACAATPATLWPPNGKLVPVHVDVAVVDATSGAGGFVLAAASTSDGDPAGEIAGFETGTADVDGLLRADRPGSAAERRYTLAYTARDHAGNTAGCAATVVVPHDRGR